MGSGHQHPAATTLRMVGWKTGLQTVSLIQLVKEESTGSLSTAKRLVQALLEGNAVDVSFGSQTGAKAFQERAEGLGAIFG